MTRLYRLSIVTVISTFFLIIFGNITRVSNSGMGCHDDWPRCQGRWYPPFELQPIIEYAHRTIAAYLGLLVLTLAVGALLVAGISRRTKVTAWLALVLVIVQALLGAVTVFRELPADIVTAHLGTAELFFATTILVTYFIAMDRGAPAWLVSLGSNAGQLRDRPFLWTAQIGTAIIFGLMLSGAYTSTTGAALACSDWPDCRNGALIPDNANTFTWIHLSHRMVAMIGIVAVAGVTLAAFRRPVAPAVRRLAAGASALIAGQALVGAAYVLSFGDGWLSTLHLGIATLLWATMLLIVISARRGWEPDLVHVKRGEKSSLRTAHGVGGQATVTMGMTSHNAVPRSLPTRQVAGAIAMPYSSFPTAKLPDLAQLRVMMSDYVALTKPGILSLLLVTTLGAMLIAAEGVPSFPLVIWTMLGGILAAGGANALNCYIDRDIDSIMARTRHRATANGRISPRAAMVFGTAMSALAVAVLGIFVNPLAAGLALAGNLYYVFVYTWWLKRTTPQNIVIGGAAGAVPPLVGWAAVTGSLSPAAWLLFAIIFYWTPPHFWSLALLKEREYDEVAVPMLPVVVGDHETRRQILLYTLLLAAVAMLLAPLGLSWIYLFSAIVLNGIFVGMAVRLWRTPSRELARSMFFYSLWYLALIFSAAVADRLILA
jgi:protoheme IX farnesyltransferase